MNTMLPAPITPEPEVPSASVLDKQAVTAVREGDTGRYRELVERYQRQVYAVAWSRLGDAALAEEATQEAFIRAYHSLPLLGDAAKFPAWISTIARNLSISLGMRHRRELNKRTRWALEQPTSEAPQVEKEEMLCTPELLRQTLAELSATHRECLVLFYLEDKSGAEAAAMLGISEAALRVRLMRARGALREKLEGRLGESLEQLRPSATMASSVMAVITSTGSAKAAGGAGVGTTMAAALGKILPLKLAIWLIPLASLVPGLGVSWIMRRAEQRNYRDAEGFRARSHREIFGRLFWFTGVLLLAIFIFTHLAFNLVGPQALFLGLGLFSLAMLGLMARSLEIKRNRFYLGIFLNTCCTTAGMLAVGLGWMPTSMFSLAIFIGAVILIPTMAGRPLRMDYNLFLRATQGLLPISAEEEQPAGRAPAHNRGTLLAFARFLGGRFLVANFRWTERGLQLSLPAAKMNALPVSQIAQHLTTRWGQRSRVELGWDGAVWAQCSERDGNFLQTMDAPAKAPTAELETRVASAVGRAWGQFRAGDMAAAERILGQVPEAEVFLVPPGRANGYRVWAGVMLAVVVAMIFFAALNARRMMVMVEIQPLRDQMKKISDQEYQEAVRINQLREPTQARTREITLLLRQALSADPAQKAALQEQVQQLLQANKDVYAQIDLILNHQDEERRAIEKLQKQIYELSPTHAPTPAATAPPVETAK